MKEKKNVDRLFQEKFKDFERHPSDVVWAKILAKKKKESRKIIPIWWRLGGIAAVLTLLIGVGSVLFSDTTGEQENNIVNTSNELNKDVEDNSESINLHAPVENGQQFKTNHQVASSDAIKTTITNRKNSRITTNNIVSNAERTPQPTNFSQVKTGNIDVVSNQKTNSTKYQKGNINQDVTIDRDKINNAFKTTTELETIASQNSLEKEKEKQENKRSLVEEANRISETRQQDEAITQLDEPLYNRWDVGAVAAPVYYGNFGGSGIDPQFSDNAKSGDVNLSYGVQISYAVSPKLKVRTGVSNVDLSYNTSDIAFTANTRSNQLPGINYSQNARALNITDRNSNSAVALGDDLIESNNLTNISNGSLQQRVGFVEIPVEAIYVLSDKKLGVELVGGMSTLLLNNNEVILNAEDGLQSNLGTANGLNNVSFTTNIGLGLNYKMTDKIKLNVEPSLKYQLNAFDKNVGDFKPYFIGLYTGVSYRF